MTFNEFNLKDLLQKAIDEAGFKEPSPIQEQAIPLIQEGNDLIACAQTGTGKTAAFVLPIIELLLRLFPSERLYIITSVPWYGL